MKERKKGGSCLPAGTGDGCCSVAAVVTVDDRGQIVLPKDIRDRAKIKAGDKLAVVTVGGSGETCCMMLMKAGELDRMVKIKVDAVLGSKGV